MKTEQIDIGKCDKCGVEFHYRLVHNGFNQSVYAYCDTCGKTAILSEMTTNINAKYRRLLRNISQYRKISKSIEPFLEQCSCNGHFRHNAAPRCPFCKATLSPILAKEYIEKNAPGTEKGWKWQNNWDDLYAIVIEDNKVNDNWKPLFPKINFKERIKNFFKIKIRK
jgi:hypothetical protein